MSQLRAAVNELAKSLSHQLKSVELAGEGQVALKLVADGDTAKTTTINIIFIDPDEYPRCGALVQLDEDASGSSSSSGLAERVSAVSERFQDGAQLCAVLTKV